MTGKAPMIGGGKWAKRTGTGSGTGTESVWLAGRKVLKVVIPSDEGEGPAEAMVVVEVGTGFVLGVSVWPPGHGGAIADLLEKTMADPAEGDPRSPDVVVVESEQLAAPLRRRFGGRIRVDVAPTPAIDSCFESLEERLAEDLDPTFTRGGQISAGLVGRFFRAAAELYRLHPWKSIPGDDFLFELSSEPLALEGSCLVVIGGAGESYGLLLFDSFEDYVSFAEMGEARMGGEEPDPEAPDFVMPLSASFEAKRDLSPAMLEEIRRNHWPVAGPRAYPLLHRPRLDAPPEWPEADEYRLAVVLLESFAKFFLAHRDEFEKVRKGELRIEEVYRVDDESGSIDLRIGAPHGNDVRYDEGDGGGGIASDRPEVEAFLGRERERGVPDAEIALAADSLEALFRIAPESSTWSGATIDALLLDELPRNAILPPDASLPVIAALGRFLGDLEAEGTLPANRASLLADRIAAIHDECRKRFADESLWSPGKREVVSFLLAHVAEIEKMGGLDLSPSRGKKKGTGKKSK